MSAERRSIVVLGGGGHACVVVDAARAAGWRVTGCLAPAAPVFPAEFCPHLGGDDALEGLDPARVLLAVGVGSIGQPALRQRLFALGRAKGFAFACVCHPAAAVAGSAVLGEGTQVLAGAVVQPFARLGENVIVNTRAVVEHHCRIGDHAHIAPGAVVCGAATIGAGAHVGAGATVSNNVEIGTGAVVALGAAVVRSVPAGATVKGVPAR